MSREGQYLFKCEDEYVTYHSLICDVIKQNESELEKQPHSFHNYMVYFKSMLKTHENSSYSSRDIAILAMFKTIKYKGNWMLLLALSKNG